MSDIKLRGERSTRACRNSACADKKKKNRQWNTVWRRMNLKHDLMGWMSQDGPKRTMECNVKSFHLGHHQFDCAAVCLQPFLRIAFFFCEKLVHKKYMGCETCLKKPFKNVTLVILKQHRVVFFYLKIIIWELFSVSLTCHRTIGSPGPCN